MTTREKLQAIVGGVEFTARFMQDRSGYTLLACDTHSIPSGTVFYTADQILPMLEQAYRMALEDAATFCDNQNYMILDPLRTRTANDECDAIKASVKFIGNSLRRMAEQIGGEG